MSLSSLISPNELPNLVSLYDASIYNSTPSGTLITTLNDLYGTNNLSLVSGGVAPYISTTKLNGRSVIESDRADTRLKMGGITFTSGVTISCVFKTEINSGSTMAGYRIFTAGLSLRFNTTTYNLHNDTSFNGGVVGDWNVVSIGYDGTKYKLFLNGKLINEVIQTTSTIVFYNYISLFGNDDSVGSSRFMKMWLAECNVCSTYLDNDTIKKHHRYLKFKWGL